MNCYFKGTMQHKLCWKCL